MSGRVETRLKLGFHIECTTLKLVLILNCFIQGHLYNIFNNVLFINTVARGTRSRNWHQVEGG